MHPNRVRVGALVLLIALAVVLAIVLRRRSQVPSERGCGPGFVVQGARCMPSDPNVCPPPLTKQAYGCDAPPLRVRISAREFDWAPNDWESPPEARQRPLHIRTNAFDIDAFEVTEGRATCAECPLHDLHGPLAPTDTYRALSRVTRSEAAYACAAWGGRLPTDAEWLAAAHAEAARYPWGDTGAVCRRAAWGLFSGPCANGADGPDSVGAHPSGSTIDGVHDLGGNVSEWVIAPDAPSEGHARGGNWRAEFAGELRTWQDLRIDIEVRDSRVGVRCVYDVPSP